MKLTPVSTEVQPFSKLLVNMSDDRFSVGQNVLFQITFKLSHLMRIELWLCARIVVIHQCMETALLITFKIVPGRLFVKEKNLSDMSCRPAFE